MGDLVHSAPQGRSIPGIGALTVAPNWQEIGPRALEALTAFATFVETSGKMQMSERDSEAMFEAYRLARAVTYAADPVADKARLHATHTARNEAQQGEVNQSHGGKG